jgi:hypothetical protein
VQNLLAFAFFCTYERGESEKFSHALGKSSPLRATVPSLVGVFFKAEWTKELKDMD